MSNISHKEIFEKEQREDRRLNALIYLTQPVSGSANTFVLKSALHISGHGVPLETVNDDMDHLASVGCVRLEKIEGVVIATITPEGREVVARVRTVPGVACPAGY